MTTTPPAEQPDEGVAAEAEGAAEPAARPKRRWLPRRRTPAAPAEGEAASADTGATAEAGAGEAGAGEAAAPAPDAEGADAPAEPTAAQPGPAEGGTRRLRRNRRRLIGRREEAVYHLGGLAFELYRRDMLTEEVMRRRAGEVAEIDDSVRDIDVRLGELERERRDRRRAEPADPSAGCCLSCRAPFRPEARFCWQCGAQLVPPSVGDEQVTAVIGRPAP